MVDGEIADWSSTPAQNDAPAPIGAPPGQARADVNDVAREMMAALRGDWEGSAVDGGPWRNPVRGKTVAFLTDKSVLISAVDATLFFPIGRKVKVGHATGNAVYGFVVSVSFGGADTTVGVDRFDDVAPDDEVRSNANAIEFYSGFGGDADHGLKGGAFASASGLFEMPPTFTAAGIIAAITAASASGRIVLLDAGTYLLEAAVIVPASCRMWGIGPGRTILKVDDTKDVSAIKIDAIDNIELRDFEIDGNAANQTASGHGIELVDGVDGLVVDGLYIHDTYEQGIAFTGTTTGHGDIVLQNLLIGPTGDHGIFVEEPTVAGTSAVFLSNIHVVNPGTGGAAVASADGIRVKGRVSLSNIQVVLDVAVASTGAGIRLDQVDVAASPSSGAHECTLSGFAITGSGTNITGLYVAGRHSRISAGSVNMSGGSAQLLQIVGRGPGIEAATENSVENVHFKDGARCSVGANAVGNEIIGCYFQDQAGVGLNVAGANTVVRGCTFVGQPKGLEVDASATDFDVKDCTFRDHTTSSLEIGASDVAVGGCSFRGGVTSIDVLSAAENCSISSCKFTGQSGLQAVLVLGDRVSIVSCDFRNSATTHVHVNGEDAFIRGCYFSGEGSDIGIAAISNSLTPVDGADGAVRCRVISCVFDGFRVNNLPFVAAVVWYCDFFTMHGCTFQNCFEAVRGAGGGDPTVVYNFFWECNAGLTDFNSGVVKHFQDNITKGTFVP